MAGRLGDAEAARALGGLVRAGPGRLRPAAVARRPLRLRRRRRRRARTASWPTSWPASGTPTRPASATSSPADRVETGAADDPRAERRAGSAAAGWARSTACARTASVDAVERAVGRGLGRHDLRAGRVHDRPRPRSTRAGRRPAARSTSPTSAACGSGRPRRTTATATSGRRSTSGRWRSGRSRKPSTGAPAPATTCARRPSPSARTRSTNRPMRRSASSSRSYDGRVAHAHVARRPTARTRRPGTTATCSSVSRRSANSRRRARSS